MITEDYVSFETSILLKEKGFNEKCDRVYMHDGKCMCAPNFMEGESFVDNDDIEAVKRYDEPNWINYIQGEYAYLCPNISLVMKWLRKIHNIHVVPKIDFYAGNYTARIYDGRRESIGEKDDYIAIVGNSTYEQAAEVAIKYCLENLI